MTAPYAGNPYGQQQQGWTPPQQGVVHTQQQFQQPMYPAQGYQPGQPMYQQQAPQFQQPAPQFQPAQPQFAPGTDFNTRLPLNDPNIPQELRGKTVGEAMRYYGIMREDFIRRQDQPPRQQQQFQQQGQGQQQHFQQGQQQQGWQRQGGQPNFGPGGQQQQQMDPVKSTVMEALNEALPAALAPILQPMQQQQLLGTYNAIKGRFGDWTQFESEILGSMQGADPTVLQNPASWEAAYYHAKGRAMTQRQLGPGQQQQQGGQQGWQNGQPQQYNQQGTFTPPPQQGYYQAPPQQGYQGPMGNQFVEGPTPQATGMGGPQQDPRDETFAKRFGMPLEVYRSWKAGRVGLLQQAAPQQQQQMQQPQYQQQQQQFQPQQFGQFQQPMIPQGYYQAGNVGGQYAP